MVEVLAPTDWRILERIIRKLIQLLNLGGVVHSGKQTQRGMCSYENWKK
jgi:hypothetical protein